VNVPWRTCEARKTVTERKPFGVFFFPLLLPSLSLAFFSFFFISIQPACASGNNAASRGRAEYQRARPVCSTFLHACPTCNLFARARFILLARILRRKYFFSTVRNDMFTSIRGDGPRVSPFREDFVRATIQVPSR